MLSLVSDYLPLSVGDFHLSSHSVLLGLRIVIEFGDSKGNSPQAQQESDNLIALFWQIIRLFIFWSGIGLIDYLFVGVWHR